jgi:hypothetical protein
MWSVIEEGQTDRSSAVVEMCAATLTELDCTFPRASAEAHDRALARCLRLESLSHVHGYTPAVWLALSQLHTLRHVDLTRVSLAAIAASLPRLHSLDAFYRPFSNPYDPPSAVMAGFFEDLLPRLRVFSFYGNWAQNGVTTTAGAARALVLEQLKWDCSTADAETGLPIGQGFIGAQPTMLRASSSMIADWLLAAAGPQCRLLAHVRRLIVISPKTVAELTEILTAAPQLRHLSVTDVRGGIYAFFLERPWEATGLVHRRLRSLQFESSQHTAERSHAPSAYCATQLQQLFFPRLRVLQVGIDVLVVERRRSRSEGL